METVYRRELNHSYMVLPNQDNSLSCRYPYRMLISNQIRHLLGCQERQVDGASWLYYEISSRQPLERLYEGKKLGTEDLHHILTSVAAVQDDISEFLLDERGLLLEPESLFADVETEELHFCFYPGSREQGNQYAALADFFLEHVDHREEHAVNIAYQFYKQSKAEYFVLASFLPFLEKETAAGRKTAEPEIWRPAAASDWDSDPAFLAETLPVEEEVKKSWLKRLAEGGKGRKKKGKKTRENKRAGQPGTEYGRPTNREPRTKYDGAANMHSEAAYGRRVNGQGIVPDTEWPRYQKPEELSLWDSYAEQIKVPDSGETVYFEDLDKPRGERRGALCLREIEGERIFLLQDMPVTVGKLARKAGILLQDNSVSRMHARFFTEDQDVMLMDLNSKNATFVNGERLEPNQAAAVREGDEIRFGRERFTLGFIDSKVL